MSPSRYGIDVVLVHRRDSIDVGRYKQPMVAAKLIPRFQYLLTRSNFQVFSNEDRVFRRFEMERSSICLG